MDIKDEILIRYPNADIEYLEKYLNLCNCPDDFGQYHHMLPRKIWPRYIKSNWNITKLSPYNHVLAHYYFSKSTGALWNAIRWFSGKNIPKNISIEEVKSMAMIYSEFIKEYKWSEEHKLNHLKAQQTDRLKILRSNNTTDWWAIRENKENLLKTRKNNYSQDAKDRRSKSQTIAQNNPITKIKRSYSMKEVWSDPNKREIYLKTAFNQRKSDYWNMPLKKELFDIWVITKPKKVAFSNLLKTKNIDLEPNKLNNLVKEFFNKGFILPKI